MKIVRTDDVESRPAAGALFSGGVVSHQGLVSPKESQISVTLMTFGAGARNAFHTHSHDQVVMVVEGKAVVATESERQTIGVGDVALFLAGENHLHAGLDGAPVKLLSITPTGTVTTVSAAQDP